MRIRQAGDDDLDALTRLDLTYPARRYLEIERHGRAPECKFEMRWREHDAPDAVYDEYTADFLRGALSRADLFLVADTDGHPVGLLMVVVPSWTDAAEITDLAVDRQARGRGAGRALVDAAAHWARKRGHRALWVEPRSDNGQAIEFYLRLGFRLSGFNDRLYSNADDAPGRTTLYMHLELQ